MAFSPAKLKTLREAKGWIPSDLAYKIWGPQTNLRTGRVGAKGRDNIFRWENGKRPKPHSLKLVADALGVQPADLCDGPAPPQARREPGKARLWEKNLQELADSLSPNDPRTPYWRDLVTRPIGWEHPVREMLDVLFR